MACPFATLGVPTAEWSSRKIAGPLFALVALALGKLHADKFDSGDPLVQDRAANPGLMKRRRARLDDRIVRSAAAAKRRDRDLDRDGVFIADEANNQ